MANELNMEKKVAILQDMMEGMSIRALHRTKKGNAGKSGRPSRTTINKLLVDAGDTAIEFLDDRMGNLPTKVIQADEMHSFVAIRGLTLARKKQKPAPGRGVFWIWIALDAPNKLVAAWHVGKRGKSDARLFINDLKDRCPHRLQLTTDHHTPYFKAVEDAWGGEIDYAAVKKRDDRDAIQASGGKPSRRKEPRKEEEKQPPVIKSGAPNEAFITTNHIESFFQKLRQNLARFRRRTALHSKSLINLKRAVALYIFYHNFIRVHETLGTTPAVAAGIDDDLWTWEHFVELVDADRAKRQLERRAEKAANQPVEAEENVIALPDLSVSLPFVVVSAVKKGYIRIHRCDCKHLRIEPDRSTKSGNSYKFPCGSLEAAWDLAYDLAPDDPVEIEECKVCLGEYRRLDLGRGKGGRNLKH